MRTIIIFLLSMMMSIAAHAQSAFELELGSGVGQVIVTPNAPQSPFFLLRFRA